jgi:hypothetical protein
VLNRKICRISTVPAVNAREIQLLNKYDIRAAKLINYIRQCFAVCLQVIAGIVFMRLTAAVHAKTYNSRQRRARR